MKKIYLIHENKEWLQPLEKVLLDKGIPFTEWNMVDETINLFIPPPEGIFFNRMSASSHSRGNRYSPELTTGLISWLEANDRFVVNGSNAQRLELSKKGGDNCDLLLMSATPIPRTMMMSLYGDMDISKITEKPSKRKEILTLSKPEKKIFPRRLPVRPLYAPLASNSLLFRSIL